MDFEFNEQQTQIKDSVDRLIERRYGFEQRMQYLREAEGFSREIWNQMAEMGLLALQFSEDDGGIGAGPEEMMIVMEAFGRGMVVEPYLASGVMASALLRRAASSAQREVWLPALIDGSSVFSWAHWEPTSRWERTHIATRAQRQSSGTWRLDGHKSLVLHGPAARHLIVTARVEGEPRDEHGLGLFVVDAGQAGLACRPYALQDGTPAAEFTLDSVLVEVPQVLGLGNSALDAIHAALDETLVATCAETLGALARMHELTVDYLKTRQQFGKPIGGFQALQHRAVDMLVHLEQARSITFHAVSALSDPDPLERRRAVHAAKARVGQASRFIGQQAVQLHGAVGMTMEYAVSHYVRRATLLELLLGDSHHHQTALSRLGGLFAAQELREEELA